MRFSSKQLERDPSETTAQLLVGLVSHFNGTGIPSRSELSLDPFVVSASARVTNALWLLSLSLALVVSMLAILAKQWITTFSSRMRAPVASLRRWAHRHRMFRDGLDRWQVNAFVSGLSVALHGAVLMFMAGLNVHLFTRDLIIFSLVLAVTVLAVLFYLAATVAPLFDGTCPTATPLLIHVRLVWFVVLGAIRSLSLRTLRSLFGVPIIPHPVLDYNPRRVDKAPFDPDAVFADDNDFQRDVRILILMFTELPSGHDVDAVLDAFGAFTSETHDLGEDLSLLRHHARRRLARFGSTLGVAASDPATAARALRSSIFIESCCNSLEWYNLGTLVTNFKSIRTHDVVALATALQLQLYVELIEPAWQSLSQLGTQEHYQLEPWMDWGAQHQREQWIEQFGQSFGVAEATVETIARWKVQEPSASYHWQPHTHACLFNGINHFISSLHTSKPVDLGLCAALIISFGGELSLRRQCNELVTPLAIAALDRERDQRGESDWQPLPDSVDCQLRAIDLWAHVTSDLSYINPSAPLVSEVYPYILTQWQSEKWWHPLPSVARLRRIVIPPDQLKLPTIARATLWQISSSTLEEKPPSPLQLGIIGDVLHGVPPDEMITAHPDIVRSIFNFVKKQLRGHQISYKHYYGAHNHLLNSLEPSSSTTSSEPRSIWEILHPYLVVFPDEKGLANLAVDASAVLFIHAWMGGDSSAPFEQLLGGRIGRQVILSVMHRGTAFHFATHVRFFAAAWWAELRNELLQKDDNPSTWTKTEGFEDAATFVRKVEEKEPCSECLQKGIEWLPRLEEDRYRDAWIQYTESAHKSMIVS